MQISLFEIPNRSVIVGRTPDRSSLSGRCWRWAGRADLAGKSLGCFQIEIGEVAGAECFEGIT